MVYLELLWSFFQIGLFSIGGGYAAMPLIQHQVVELHPWLTMNQFADVMTISEMTPGPIAINCATFVGYRRGGFWGSVAATLGVVTPSFLIIWLISLFLDNFLEITWIASAFRGIRACVGVLILDVGIKMLKNIKRKPLPVSILAVSCIAMVLITLTDTRISSIALMLCAGFVSLSIYLAKSKGGAA